MWIFFSEWHKKLTDDQINKAYDRTLKLETEFGEYFTGMYFSSHYFN